MANRIVNALGWLGTALVVASVGVRFGLPAQEQYAVYLAWAGLVCILAYLAGQWREIARIFGGRQARYGSLSATSVLIVIGILAAVNYIGQRQNKRWDFTANQEFSLSPQTKQVLSKLDAPMQILVFAQEPDFSNYRDQLGEYAYLSKNISTEYIDPDKKPALAQDNKVQQYGTIVIKYKGRSERVTSLTEQDITNGIIKAVSGAQKKLYFTSGHGEHSVTGTDRDGYASIVGQLKNENYDVEPLVLAQQSAVPADATAVVIAGPHTDFLQPEIDALKAYLAKQGKVLMELDPPASATAAPLTNLIALAHDWGFDVGNDIVVDASGMGRLFGGDASVPVAANYPSHPITENFNVMTAFPMTRSVTVVSGGVDGHIPQPIVETSPRSWAESDIKDLLASGKVTFDASQGDKQGPITIGAAVSAAPMTQKTSADTGPQPETRMVVMGDSDFASNAALGIQGNKDLFMNIVDWLSQQEDLISIRPKQAEDRRITLTSAQQTNIIWLSLLVIPGVIFASGIYTWWQRR